MIYGDFHVHTTFCDGKNTAEELVQTALQKGLSFLGFSGHSHTVIDESYCVRDTVAYKKEIARLKEAYAGQMDIYCGIEQVYQTQEGTEDYDYAIGSVHYFLKDGILRDVDHTAALLEKTVEELFHGDWYAMAEHYYADVADLPNRHKIDIVGHFDLITKFNAENRFFDEEHPRYLAAAFDALDSLLKRDLPFEVNTGVMFRGYRQMPYPAMPLLKRIKEKGGYVLLSGDVHRAQGLCYGFETWYPGLRDMGLNILSFPEIVRK